MAVPCHAASVPEALLPEAEAVAEAAPSGAAEVLEGLELEDAALDEGLRRIFHSAVEQLHLLAGEVLRPVCVVLAVSLLCAFGEPLRNSGENRIDYITLGGCLAVACAALSDVRSVLMLGSETVEELEEYSRVLLPVLTTAAVSAGALSSAGAKYAAAALFSDLMLRGARDVIFPLICGFTATVTCRAALGTKQLDGAVELLRFATQKLMKWMVLAFTAYLSLTGMITGSTDRAAVQAAKTALSTALPVVGKTLSDASASLIAGAGVIRNSVGLFGMLTVLAAIVVPVLRIGLRYLLFKLAAAAAGIFNGGRLEKLINDIGTAYGMILGLVGAAAAYLLLAAVSLMQSVSG